MSYRISILLAVVLSVPAFAQEHSHHPAKPATLDVGSRQSPSSGFDAQLAGPAVFRSGAAPDLRLQSRRGGAFDSGVPRSSIPLSRWPTGASRKPWGQTTTIPPKPSASSRRTRRFKRRSTLRSRFAERTGLHPGDGEAFPADRKADRRKAAEHYHDAMRQLMATSRRPGCGHTIRRGRHQPPSLGLVASRWHAGSRNRGNRRLPSSR